MSKKQMNNSPSVELAPYDVAIIGGGASGLACAVACAQQAPGARILVIEAGRRIGASIMRSGNGRCNFSNAHIDVERYEGAPFVRETFRAAAADPDFRSVTSWFEDLGLVWEEAAGSDGLLFPYSRKANSVLDVLRRAVGEAGVQVQAESRVMRVKQAGAGFVLDVEQTLPGNAQGGSAHATAKSARGKSGKGGRAALSTRTLTVQACKVVVAAGGGFADGLLAGAGTDARIPVTPWQPVLGPLAAEAAPGVSLPSLANVRAQARVTMPKRGFSEEGEVLFRDYGLSGIVVFNASRVARPGDALVLDLAPNYDPMQLEEFMRYRLERFPERAGEAFLDGFFAAPLSRALFAAAGIGTHTPLKTADAAKLAKAVKAFPFTVRGIADARQCQVRRGGVDTSALDPATMQVCNAPGLYVLGEAANVDGPCGGYNLHWAWTSGVVAGHAIAALLECGKGGFSC